MTTETLKPLFPIIDGKYKMKKEPVVRIGIILAQDNYGSVTLNTEEVKSVWENSEKQEVYSCSKNTSFQIALSENKDKVNLFEEGSDTEVIATSNILRLCPMPRESDERETVGTLVKGLIAGRGFHWMKHIDQHLTGVLEFRSEKNKLLLVNELPLEDYLKGVATSEMSANCPPEYIKAQTVAARSWLLGQMQSCHPGQPYEWCNDDCCQRYQGTDGWSDVSSKAVDDCHGEVLITPNKLYCDARYSKSTGGISEDASFVWPKDEMECLDARVDGPAKSTAEKFMPVTDDNVEEYLGGDWLQDTDLYCSPNAVSEDDLTRYMGRVDESGTYFRWKVTTDVNDTINTLKNKGVIDDIVALTDIITGKRGRSGRLSELTLKYIKSNGEEASYLIEDQYNIRDFMSAKFLYSSLFIVTDVERDSDGHITRYTLFGGGWGHGVGLCQIGGLGRALAGQNYREILAHYFPGSKLESIYP